MQDPDNMKNMTCVSYIEKKIADIQGFMNKCIEDGVRAPADVKTKFFELSKQKAVSLIICHYFVSRLYLTKPIVAS